MSSYEVDTDDSYDGIEFEAIATEELDRAAVKTVNEWVDNMLAQDYKATGDTVNSIAWDSPEQYVRVVGSDRIAALIGEFGRPPGAGQPPPDALGDWVHEQSGLPSRGETVEWTFDKWAAEGEGTTHELTFEQVVFIIGRAIDDRGLPAHHFGQQAFDVVVGEFEADINQRLDDAIDEQST